MKKKRQINKEACGRAKDDKEKKYVEKSKKGKEHKQIRIRGNTDLTIEKKVGHKLFLRFTMQN
jgi:hypothetical protein